MADLEKQALDVRGKLEKNQGTVRRKLHIWKVSKGKFIYGKFIVEESVA